MYRIIRFLLATAGVLGTFTALAQVPTTLPVTGNLNTILGSPQPYAGVSISLQNCASPVAITGYNVIVQTTQEIQANASGVVNASVWPNDLITCNGTTGNSQYIVTYIVDGVPSGTPQCFQVLSTQGQWNLNTQQPIACSQTPPNVQDATYRNLNVNGFLQANNGEFSGSETVLGILYATGGVTLGTTPTACAGTNFMTGLSSTLQPICGPVSTGVLSFNGRTGAVSPASGDYSYAQISGTPTIYYQTVEAAGAAVAQQPILNFDSSLSTTAATGQTNVGLPSVGTAGTYANPSSITTDSKGRITSITAGGTSTTVDYYWTVTGVCTTGTGQPVQCTGTAALPGAMPDSSYQLSCDAHPTSAAVDGHCTIDKEAAFPTTSGGTFTVRVTQTMQNGTGGSTWDLSMHAHHN